MDYSSDHLSAVKVPAILLLVVYLGFLAVLGACRAEVGETELLFETIERQDIPDGGRYYQDAKPRLVVITEAAEIDALDDTVSLSAQAQLAELDYNQDFAIAVFQGLRPSQPTPQSGVEVQRVTLEAGVVTLHVRLYGPVAGYESRPIETSAYEIIKLHKSSILQGELWFVLSVGDAEVIWLTHLVPPHEDPTPTVWLSPYPWPTDAPTRPVTPYPPPEPTATAAPTRVVTPSSTSTPQPSPTHRPSPILREWAGWTPVAKGPSPTPSPTRVPLPLTPIPEGTPPDGLSSLYYVAKWEERVEWRVIEMDAEGQRWSDSMGFDGVMGGMILLRSYLSADERQLTLQFGAQMGGPPDTRIVNRVSGEVITCLLPVLDPCWGVFDGWLSDGRFLYQPSEKRLEDVPWGGVLVVDPQTGRYSLLDLPVQPEWGYCVAGNLSLSPDGSQLAYSVVEVKDSEEFTGIWTMRMDGSERIKIFLAKGMIGSLEWSPDGKQLLFTRQVVSIQSLPAEIWLVNADGSGTRLLADSLPDPGSHASRPTWSPDGRHVAFVRYDQPTLSDGEYIPLALSNIYVVDTLTGAITRLSAFEQRESRYPTWSPDGNFVAFVSTSRVTSDTLWGEVWVAKADGSLLFPVADSARPLDALVWLPPASYTE